MTSSITSPTSIAATATAVINTTSMSINALAQSGEQQKTSKPMTKGAGAVIQLSSRLDLGFTPDMYGVYFGEDNYFSRGDWLESLDGSPVLFHSLTEAVLERDKQANSMQAAMVGVYPFLAPRIMGRKKDANLDFLNLPNACATIGVSGSFGIRVLATFNNKQNAVDVIQFKGFVLSALQLYKITGIPDARIFNREDAATLVDSE